ncbi:unnamed protein product [Amoebophrya sp. A120]|nr:unnamed protein product [Amoebophrya sp. A120]|eukprot:GSA120T00003088001.1
MQYLSALSLKERRTPSRRLDLLAVAKIIYNRFTTTITLLFWIANKYLLLFS